MANPKWYAGMKAVNPSGRPKHSVRTVKGMVERFVLRNITPNKLQRMFDVLNEKEKLNMLSELLPYVAAKQTNIDAMSTSDVDKVYNDLMNAIQNKDAKAI